MARLLFVFCLLALSEARATQTHYIKDTESQLKIDDLIAADSGSGLTPLDWQPLETATPAFGFSTSSYWIRIDLPLQQAEEQIFWVPYALIDTLELHQYRLHPDAGLIPVYAVKTGDLLAFSHRPLPTRGFSFPLKFDDTKNDRIYVRMAGTDSLQLPWSLQPLPQFVAAEQQESLILGLAFGLLLIMLLYHTILYIGSRDRNQRNYCIFVASNLLLMLLQKGLLFQYLLSDFPVINNLLIPVSISLTVVASAIFVYHLLRIDRLGGQQARLLQITAIVSGVVSVICAVAPGNVTLLLSLGLSVVAVGVIFSISLMRAATGSRTARYLLLGWTAYILGGLTFIASRFGLIEPSAFTENSLLLGLCAEIVLASMAMVTRYNQTRNQLLFAQQKQTEQERELRIAQELIATTARRASDRLETEVQRRTNDLERTTRELEAANEQLTALARIDALTGLHNRRYLAELFATLSAGLKRSAHASSQPVQREVSIIIGDIDHFKPINDQYGHETGDHCIRSVAVAMQRAVARPDDHIIRYGGEEYLIVLPDTQLEDAIAIAERVRLRVTELAPEGLPPGKGLTMSFGVSSVVIDSETPAPEQILHEGIIAADTMLYKAKHAGRNQTAA
ncbi:diguanylate cyclase [Allohahella marinimesophila]|uniref:diguanylate cyclase n=1 Tax=Allohahella marinimesophila TaxID=1054972 RepID=A0ABP7NIZ0_9GAMM